jgi:ADP-ribosylglycohydrolase
MLIELAIGDAYGAGFEYASKQFVEHHNDLSGYIQHPRHTIKPGHYTDDTQMSLAIAEAIIANDPWTSENLANRFVNVFKRDPREGYAQGFYHFLLDVSDGRDFIERIQPESDKSGAAMRAAPIGVFKTVEEVIEKCQVQASLTHNTPEGINAAICAALATHYLLFQLGSKKSLGHFLEKYIPGDWSKPWHGKVGSKGWMSVRAAITAISGSSSMSELLRRCVAFTGDVDTVAAIALAAGSCSIEIEQDLPTHMHQFLENGLFGYDYIKNLDKKLLAMCT